MIMNYVLSFCKITAASRIFSRNFYLPLLKPITPKDALRTFKITGKWLLGAKIQHYIPVLLNHKKKRPKNAPHKYDSSYTYMTPVLEDDNESHKMLKERIENSIAINENTEIVFVYTVDDKMCNIVMPEYLELAIRAGDIIDVMVSQSDDKILIKLKDFKKIPVPLQFFDENATYLKGEGQTSVEEEQFHHHGKLIMSLTKIFEAKELADEWEVEMMKIVAKKKKQKGEGSKEWNDMIEQSIENLNWQQFEVEAKKVIDQIWEPVREDHIGMMVEDLEKTQNILEFINSQGEAFLSLLPTLSEIPEVIKNMSNGTFEELEGDNRSVTGVRVTLSNGKECFIFGQIVKTDDGDIFVPGQTIQNEFGLSYAPGMTVLMDGKPHLIKGLIMGEEGENAQKPMFLPTESSITTDGQLTFCRNPEELSKAQPHKIFIKRKKDKKKKQKCSKKKKLESPEPMLNTIEEDSAESTNEPLINLEAVIIIEPQTQEESKTQSEEELEEFIKLEQQVEMESKREEEEEDEEEEEKVAVDMKNPDDGMQKLIVNLEDKKLELQERLEELRKLTVTLENSVTYVQLSDAESLATEITPDAERVHKIADILLTLTRRANTFRERHTVDIRNIDNPSLVYADTFVTEADEKFHAASNGVKKALKSAVYAANEVFKTRPKDQLLALNTICRVLKDNIDDNCVDNLCSLMNTKLDRNEICTSILKSLTEEVHESKTEVLKSLIKEFDLEKIEFILGSGPFSSAFKLLSKNSDGVINAKVQSEIALKMDSIKTEMGAKEALQVSIQAACKHFAQESLENLQVDSDFIQEAGSLAKTLGLYEVEEYLKTANLAVLKSTDSTREFLKRFILIRSLCLRDYSIKTSLERIRKHPECGRKDPRIRQLLLESACLLSKSKDIRSSLEVPLRYFKELNFLAIEDSVFMQTRIESPILISRKGIQAIVPKEAARNVLAGRVPYTLIDESGVTHFKPMHMFTALKLGKSREKQFMDYPLTRRESVDSLRRNSLSDARMTA